MVTGLIVLALLVVLSAFFSSSETAIFSVSLIRVKTLARTKASAAILEKMRENTQLLLGTLLLGNNVVNIAASALATTLAIQTFGNAAVGATAGILTLVILVFGEFIPKSYAAQNCEKMALAVARPIFYMMTAAAPLVRLLDKSARLVVRRDSKPPLPRISEEEIKTMAQMGVSAGTLEKGEKELIEKVFLFNDITAHDVMTPEEEIVYLDGRKYVSDILPIVNSSGYSRYPVFDGDKRKIIGIVHIKDIFRKISENPELPLTQLAVKDTVEPATFVPKTKPIDDLLRDMQKQHVHMAMVVNEYGTIVGLVTFEDLIEELVGEIIDESDIDEHVIKRVDKLTIVAHGEAEIKDINRFFNTKLTAPPHKSIGWLILKELGSIPTKGQQVKLNDSVMAVVEEMVNLRIHRVKLSKTEE